MIAFDSLNTNPGRPKLFSDSLEWVNCDRFPNDPKINYTVYHSNPAAFDQVAVYVILNGRNAILSLYQNATGSEYTAFSLVGGAGTIVGLALKNKNLYASINPVNLQNGGSTNLQFSAISETALRTKLATIH